MDIRGHDCYLLDDGTDDTVVTVDGTEVRFSDTADYRDEVTGGLTEEGFIKLCNEAIDCLDN